MNSLTPISNRHWYRGSAMKCFGLMDGTERARSLSPTKSSSNTGTPSSIRSPMNLSRQEDLSRSPSLLQQSAVTRDSRMESQLNNPHGPRKFDFGGMADTPREPLQPSSETVGSSNITSSPAANLSRAGTLSWQQRPLSRVSPGPRSRPLSMFAPKDTGTVTPPGSVDSPALAEQPVSRDQIARSLDTKDPSWFRQTGDRGDRSAAYRKQPDDIQSDTTASMGKVRLQGLFSGLNAEPRKETSPPAEILRSKSPSLDGSSQSKSSFNLRHSTSASLSSAGGFRSPLPTLQSQRFEPPSSDSASSQGGERQPSRRALAMSPSQGRISPERMERPPSPTKGLGGFVQSAMLKRSDSVNKRWSAQAGSGLSRENSIASNRNGYEGSRSALGIVNPTREPKPGSLSRDGSPVSSSRPGSSHSNATITQSGIEIGRSNSTITTASGKPDFSENEFAKPALPPLKLSPTIPASHGSTDEQVSDNTASTSPSKRWSPTKASWLENAIKKPDLPKPKLPPPTQPNWMLNRAKGKHDKESLDIEQDRSVQGIAGVDLVRMPPPDTPVKSHSVPLLPRKSDVISATEPTVKITEKADEVRNPIAEPKKGDGPANQSESRQATPLTPKRDPSLLRKDTKPAYRENPSSPPTLTYNAKTEPRFGSPSTAEPVSQTPQKDFRSNLKSRRASIEKDSKEEIEFKSVFGKLKRTQTQNYIAPDELKDNILRGKAGLAITGGPKKTEHKDEFKESLLKQREAIKAGISPKVPPKPSGKSFSNDRKSPVPEAIAKKEGLTRSKSGLEGGEPRIRSEPDNPKRNEESNLGKESEKDKPKNLFDKQTTSRQRETAADRGSADPFTSSLAGLLSRGPPPLLGSANSSGTIGRSREAKDTSQSITAGETESNGRPLTHMTKSRAKGPKRRLPAIEKRSDTTDERATSLSRSAEIKLPKTRARKSSTGDQSRVSSQIRDRSAPRPLANISNNNNRKPSQPPTPRKPSTNVTPPIEAKPTSPTPKPFIQDILTKPVTTSSPTIKPKAVMSTSDNLAIKRSTSSDQPAQVLAQKPPRVDEPPPPKPPPHAPTHDHSTQELSLKPFGSLKVVAGTWGKPSASDLAQPAGTNSPVKPLGHRAEITPFAEVTTGNKGKPQPIGLGIETTSGESQRVAPLDRNLPSPPIKSPPLSHSPKSPPLPGKKPASIGDRISSVRSPPQGTSQTDNFAASSAPLVPNVLSSYTGEILTSCPSITIDTQAVLASSSSNDNSNKIKTLRKQIWEITGHGKSIPVPSHQEHILFEDSLYLCTHVFGTPNGTRTTEIYLWCGCGVAESAADDAQIFARKVAKEHNGKLLILQQGKETSNFFQALGGIVITRRGSSSRGESPSKSAATYMLCGRRHVGQIAFDEVDYSTSSLCKAFPFLISARLGKLYLWKGAGSGVDELGCARLIGMDLGLAGEIEEVDDGHEPDEFWEALPGGKHGRMMDFQHWHLRPVCEKYVTRLFGIEVEPSRPKSSSGFTWRRRESAPQEENSHLVARVREFTPFAQNDMARDGIYVLDAFFEVFV